MSQIQPTQGRITFKEDGDANHYSMLTEDGRWWLAILANGEQTSARQVANFRRLAACWNACDGVSTEVLEDTTSSEREILHHYVAMKAQRDELLDTLKDLQGRLLRCAATGASASEAFDSFYKEVVDGAIANAELCGGASATNAVLNGKT